MRIPGLLLVASSLITFSAAAAVQGHYPTRGVPTGGTIVTIYGTELTAPSVHCDCNSTFCAGVRVYFGDAQAIVKTASPESVVVWTPAGTGTADIRIESEGHPGVTIPNAFTWDPDAPPTQADTNRFLVPITAHEVPGANGSLWTSELTMMQSHADTSLRGRFCPETAICAPTLEVQALTSTPVRLYPSGANEGAFVYLSRYYAYNLATQLRVRDMARGDVNFGSEIPIVDVDRDFRSTQTLLDVPTDPRYRALLRVYGPDDHAWRVVVSVYPPSGNDAIEHHELVLNGRVEDASAIPLNPGYLALNPITETVRASGYERVRIEVASAIEWDPPAPSTVWAFVSLTNNLTNQFVVITPQHPRTD